LRWWVGNLDIDEWPVRFVGISAGPSRDSCFRRWVTEHLKVGDHERRLMNQRNCSIFARPKETPTSWLTHAHLAAWTYSSLSTIAAQDGQQVFG
jgi:hypothetical protein